MWHQSAAAAECMSMAVVSCTGTLVASDDSCCSRRPFTWFICACPEGLFGAVLAVTGSSGTCCLHCTL